MAYQLQAGWPVLSNLVIRLSEAGQSYLVSGQLTSHADNKIIRLTFDREVYFSDSVIDAVEGEIGDFLTFLSAENYVVLPDPFL